MSRTIGLVTGFVIEMAMIGILMLGDLQHHVPVFFVMFGIAVGMYLIAVWQSPGIPLWLIVLFGVAFRMTLISTTPSLSDDIYRYVWDGRVQAAGINPFLYAPADESVAHLRDDDIYPNINHREISTVYPPMAQLLFLLGYWITPTIWGIKFLLVGFDLLGAWFVLGLIRALDRHPGQLLIYLWNPLLIVEVSGSGHVDILGISFLVISMCYLAIGGNGRAFGALALSFLSKYFAVCLLPIYWRWICASNADGWRERLFNMLHPKRAWPVVIFPVIVCLGFLPYLGAGEGLWAGLFVYAEHWEFNAPVFTFLRYLLGTGTLARQCIGLFFGGAVLACTLARIPPIQAGYFLTGAFVLMTPTLHPWYMIWILPFLVFYRRPAWLAFTGLIAMAYHVMIRYVAEGVWEEAAWIKWMEFGGLAAIAGGSLLWRKFQAMKQ